MDRSECKAKAVEVANSTFGLQLQRRNDDIADAICIGLAAVADMERKAAKAAQH